MSPIPNSIVLTVPRELTLLWYQVIGSIIVQFKAEPNSAYKFHGVKESVAVWMLDVCFDVSMLCSIRFSNPANVVISDIGVVPVVRQ